jgi:hypothetical protein
MPELFTRRIEMGFPREKEPSEIHNLYFTR